MTENLNLKTVDTVDTRPFKKLVMTIGELPSSFIESMTYYELLAWFTNYLETVVIPTVNNNAEATEELQGLFTQLKNYVDNYFDNLDVQDEINNKLDAMAADGTLEQIFIQDNIIYVKRPGRNLTPMNFDGSDETTELQAIVNWALANGGGKIILPVGSTKISKLSISEHGPINIEIIGQGDGTILESITNNNDAMIDIESDDENVQIDRLVLDNFAIIRNTAQTNITGIKLVNVCNESVIKNMFIKGFETGIDLEKCWTIKVLNNNIYRCNNIGVAVRTETHNSTIAGNKISYNNNIGLSIRSVYEVNVENNDIEGNDGTGIVLYNTRQVNIFKNYIENNGVGDADNYYEIEIESNSLSCNIMFNYINANSVNNVIKINPTSTNIDIRNNTFVSGSAGKKLVVCNASTNTAVSGSFVDNTHGSFDSGMTPFSLGSASFRVDYYTNNQEVHSTNGTTYKRLVASSGDYVIRTGKNGAVRFELNYNGNNPLFNIATGNAGSEEYKKIIELMSDLNVEVRKSLSFSTQQTSADITHNSCLFVAPNGALRFKDMNGVVKEITMTNV